ncbi:MAG: His/Gly/Thr/Pro-type tRNA ligase C-terminal domain-containing protein, partial [Kiloniellales bacterium]|nr:His/Gly/Thr/Pro-type tRNA ligase C-terminal domain-containing protein [Kiloniellales bacterium]
ILIAEAPVFSDYLNDYSRDYFAKVRAGLDELGIAYQVNPRLVRGLDYYTHTAFEFVTTELGAQGAVLAGGRYDGLSESMGGPATPATGWAGGVERLAMLLADLPEPPRPIAVIPIGEASEAPALRLSEDLRRKGLQVDLGFAGNLSKRMKRANKLNARFAVLLGEDELAAKVATLRDLDTGAQETVALDQLAEHLADRT